uniref:Uncharacterized protein n=1 Tax=Cyprinus carpio TaxID=7962 RepID=A0A8C2FZ51_CYPCA
MFLHFCICIVVCSGKPLVQYESARNRRQVKSSGSMISADDVTAARRSVPFPPVFTTSTCEDVDRRPIRRARSKSDTPYLTETRLSYTLQTGECGCALLYCINTMLLSYIPWY